MNIAVLDIGGTAIKSGIWTGKALEGQREQATYAAEGGARLMQRVKKILREYGDFQAIGISTAGQVNTRDGSIFYANDNIPGYTGTKVKGLLEEEFHVPTAVENDVNAAALGELHYGAAKGLSDFLCLTYGTGVGGAIVIRGGIYYGSSFSAGSFGGIVVHPEYLGKEEYSGCYEKFASVTALINMARKIDSTLDNGKKIFAAIDRPEVKKAVDQWIDEVTYGLVSLAHVFNPGDIVLGGGVMAQQYVIGEIQKRLPGRISPGVRRMHVRQALLGNQAGLMGAVHLAEKLAEQRKNALTCRGAG